MNHFSWNAAKKNRENNQNTRWPSHPSRPLPNHPRSIFSTAWKVTAKKRESKDKDRVQLISVFRLRGTKSPIIRGLISALLSPRCFRSSVAVRSKSTEKRNRVRRIIVIWPLVKATRCEWRLRKMIVEESKRLAKPSKSIPNVVKYALYVSVAFFFVSLRGAKALCFLRWSEILFPLDKKYSVCHWTPRGRRGKLVFLKWYGQEKRNFLSLSAPSEKCEEKGRRKTK